MSEYIPLEIQAEILKRLSLKPLLQFRTVSKSFKGLIDNPDFINSHVVHHHPQQPHDRFILRYVLNWSTGYCDQERYITFVDDDDRFVLQGFISPVPDLIKTLKFSNVVGSSHGLLCFSGYYYEHSDDHSSRTEMVVLWNVSIRKSVGIRVPDICDKPNGKFYDHNVHSVFGFGVCPVTFDPTVIKITSVHYRRNRNDIRRISLPWIVGVFTWSSGTWSILSTNIPRGSIRLRRSQVIIDRFIYWVAYDMFDPEDGIDAQEALPQSRFLIVSFDLTAKEFKEIRLTGSLTNFRCKIPSISKLRESLVLLAYHFEEQVSACHCLWMMNEEGVSRSFTKLYTIKVEDASIRQILGFKKTGELIMETSYKSEKTTNVQIYEPNNEYVENLEIDGKDFASFMCFYTETLYLLDKPDGYIYLPRVAV
uniref:F-box protein CPR1-like n=1 Tax=Erigeron canadensis TaxID=72917 RepID=UPI001CB88F65|nr:F-box protein CPR1-like [Erigeron canadensis]